MSAVRTGGDSRPVDNVGRSVDDRGIPAVFLYTAVHEGSANADAWKEQAHSQATALAWHRWRIESCTEFNGGHDLRLRCRLGSSPVIACAHGCPVDLDDFYPDGYDLLTYDLPVTVHTEIEHYPATPNQNDEWDVKVWLEPRADD